MPKISVLGITTVLILSMVVGRLMILISTMMLLVPCLMAEDKAEVEHQAPPRAEPVRPASQSRVSAADLELVERVFQEKKKRPTDLSDGEVISELESTWQSYWWSGEDALFNTKGLVITGQTDWGPNWKPYGLIGLEEQVTFESYGKRRDAHLGVGVKYAFTEQLARIFHPMLVSVYKYVRNPTGAIFRRCRV